MSHTNTAAIKFAATDVLLAAGRLHEHELWDADPYVRCYIDNQFRDAITVLANFIDCDLVPRPAVNAALTAAAEAGYVPLRDYVEAVTCAPGFDGRDTTAVPSDVIEDMEWSR